MNDKEQDVQLVSVRLAPGDDGIVIIDQTQLPNRLVYRTVDQPQDMYEAIKQLQVRGAPAIGIFAGYAMYVLARQRVRLPYEQFAAELTKLGDYLVASRPTAVNLSWAVDRQKRLIVKLGGQPVAGIVQALGDQARAIHQDDIASCRRIAEYGLSLVKPGDGILTHCNAGPLATSRYGTATGPMFLAREKGIPLHVFADETRPLLQGARLTSLELSRAGIDVTLICDNMASIVMKNGWVQACFVGCDRVAANGDFANKIGTSGVAILARHYGIPFYTLGPASTIDMACPTGADIRIELRDPDEIKQMWYREPMAPQAVKCYNPSFDVTDHQLLTAIVTDRGIVYPPFEDNLKKLFAQGKR